MAKKKKRAWQEVPLKKGLVLRYRFAKQTRDSDLVEFELVERTPDGELTLAMGLGDVWRFEGDFGLKGLLQRLKPRKRAKPAASH